MNVMGVSLSIWLVIFGHKHNNSERGQIAGVISVVVTAPEPLYNPLPKMWKCIAINIASTTVALIRTIYFMAAPEMDCRYTKVPSLQLPE